MGDCFIYGLIDPRDGSIFYVGQTSRGSIEPEGYIKTAHRFPTRRPLRRYLRRIYNLGLTAHWEILEEVDENQLNDAEKFWIASLRASGAILSNRADGGPTNKGYRWTVEQKENQRIVQAAANSRPEVIANKIAAQNRPDVKARASEKQREVQNRPEIKAKRSASLKASHSKPETVAKLSATATEQWKRWREKNGS